MESHGDGKELRQWKNIPWKKVRLFNKKVFLDLVDFTLWAERGTSLPQQELCMYKKDILMIKTQVWYIL